MAGECSTNMTGEFADRPEISQGQAALWEEVHKGASGCLKALLTVSWGTEL